MYYHSAMLAAEAAITLLQEEIMPDREENYKELYGILTPSCLGIGFVERIRVAGVRIEAFGVEKVH